MSLALWASGLWLRYATLQNLIPSFPWIVPHALHPGAIQGKEGIKFCRLATQVINLDYGEEEEEDDPSLQLLPPREASQSVAKFRKDPEQPTASLHGGKYQILRVIL